MPEKLPFRPGKLRIGGHFVVRATIEMLDPSKSYRELGNWAVRLLDPDADASFEIVVGDLAVTFSGRLIGVTVASNVILPPRTERETVPAAPLLEAVKFLYGESLWDAASGVARQLAAIAILERFRLPMQPPATEEFDLKPWSSERETPDASE